MHKQTKIVCTIGPASESYEILLKMAKAGMNIARLNFSHGDYADHKARIDMVRKVASENNLNIGIMLDTKGPEIRLGDFANGEEEYKIGEEVELVKEKIMGSHERFHVQCAELFDDVKSGDVILINDGKQRLTVLENKGDSLRCRIEVNGVISSRKGCNVPGVKLSMPFISKKDEEDIRFGVENGVDFIAASFVRRKEDVIELRNLLKKYGKEKLNIIAKIENQEGYDNLEEILEVVDGIMVARGDLGVEIPTSMVPIYQKRMIRLSNLYGKYVIVATHMLDSMTHNPRCTRAEASDVANAVLDGGDSVMLSAESAAGEYPVEAVSTMAEIALAAENTFSHKYYLNHLRERVANSIQDTIGLTAVEACMNLDIKAIIVFTQGGTTARRISKYRPTVPIYAVTFSKEVLGALTVSWGVHPVLSDVQNNMTNDDELASKVAKENGIKPGELILLSAGYPTGEGSANMIKIIAVK